ncbi:MAG TPA: hypothetical protein VHQ87_14605, partial [Rhizobacter sp.]|nr:hypothetical protein [Rhizobacter sp.]
MSTIERELSQETAPKPEAVPLRYEPATAVRSSAATNLLATLAATATLWWGERFLVPVTAGLMLVMLVAPLTVWLEHLLHSRTLATLLTLALVVGTLLEGAM